MRHVREVLRLRTAGVSGNEIARRLNLAPSTVRLTLQRLTTAGLDWPLPAELTDAALEARLFSAVGTKQGHRRRAEPDWARTLPGPAALFSTPFAPISRGFRRFFAGYSPHLRVPVDRDHRFRRKMITGCGGT